MTRRVSSSEPNDTSTWLKDNVVQNLVAGRFKAGGKTARITTTLVNHFSNATLAE